MEFTESCVSRNSRKTSFTGNGTRNSILFLCFRVKSLLVGASLLIYIMNWLCMGVSVRRGTLGHEFPSERLTWLIKKVVIAMTVTEISNIPIQH